MHVDFERTNGHAARRLGNKTTGQCHKGGVAAAKAQFLVYMPWKPPPYWLLWQEINRPGRTRMVVVKTPLVPIRMTAEAPTAARTHAKVLQHELVMDEPESRHGTDLGPTPLDTLVASLAGCTTVLLNKIAQEQGVDVRDLAMELTSDLNVRGILGIEKVDRPLERIGLIIRFATNAPPDKISSLKSQLPERCAVSVILRQAGIAIDYGWQIEQG